MGNEVNNDWLPLPVEAEARQNWPPTNDKLTKLERQRKKKKEKCIVIHKIAKEKKYKTLLTLEL